MAPSNDNLEPDLLKRADGARAFPTISQEDPALGRRVCFTKLQADTPNTLSVQ
jgi:hypothetical protein